ncbi:MAG: tetratricopeptide repeat protein, partial [Candidatus Obscuribacterales bacterium]|nr:tetratricopeptide repeat protein [Candidatus Obscuribacterales bacterium]
MLSQSAGYDNATIFSPISEFIPWGGAPDLPDALLKLAEIYCLQGRTDQAEPLFEKAITVITDKFGASDQRTLNAIERRSKAQSGAQ